jgi:2-dehydropantoate 2-reductase
MMRASTVAHALHRVWSRRDINSVARPGDSSWQSLARATGSIETDFLNAEITMLGRLHGIATPINAMVHDLAARCARERRPPASIPVEDVRRLRHQAASAQGDERLP